MADALLALANPLAGSLSAFLSVAAIDLVLAGDNAVAVGLAAGGLPREQRRKVILYGLGAAVALRIGFAMAATWLLGVTGLLLVGGLLLLWVSWNMAGDLRERLTARQEQARASPEDAAASHAKSFGAAFLQVLIADVSMSLDNVLAVAGAAREHPAVLVLGLLLSIVLMGFAANAVAGLLQRHVWIGFVGLAIILYVALHMVWQGSRDLAADWPHVRAYNVAAPGVRPPDDRQGAPRACTTPASGRC